MSCIKKRSQKSSQPAQSHQITTAEIRHHLEHWDRQRLIDFIMEQGSENALLRERLQGIVACALPSDIPVVKLEAAIRDATDFSDWDSDDGYGSGYSDKLKLIITALQQWLERGYATEIVELVEYTIEKVEAALDEGHDSEDGELRVLLPILADLHQKACRQDTSLDVLALAERLFEMELFGETIRNVSINYADILGQKGLARYSQKLQAQWDQLPPLTPENKNKGTDYKRSRVTAMMEFLVQQSGDIEALVQVKSRDLSKAGHFLDIAQLYQEVGQEEQALEWAERGVHTFSKNKTAYGSPDLQYFLAGLYQQKDRHNEAIYLIWDLLDATPGFQNYKLLKMQVELAISTGASWADWQNKALARIRAEIEAQKTTKQATFWGPADHSELVQIFLWEDDLEAAWKEAKQGGCTKKLWLNLAHQLEAEAPDKAASIYQQWVESTIEIKKNTTYEEAVGYLQKINRLMNVLKQEEAFNTYLTKIRFTHKAKRNFIKLLDSSKLGASIFLIARGASK
jgi:tetratricopeptide (TPR) repeat protein